jgi:hypothetical protein
MYYMVEFGAWRRGVWLEFGGIEGLEFHPFKVEVRVRFTAVAYEGCLRLQCRFCVSFVLNLYTVARRPTQLNLMKGEAP